MKETELRIGNLVQDEETGTITKVNVHLFMHVCSLRGLLSGFINPIPLTEEWLKRFGFRKLKRKGTYGSIYVISDIDSNLCIERDFNKEISYFVGIEYTDSPYKEDKNKIYHYSYDLKYVHQLQNLYFALTGNELELK
jgi:hypothetical protein